MASAKDKNSCKVKLYSSNITEYQAKDYKIPEGQSSKLMNSNSTSSMKYKQEQTNKTKSPKPCIQSHVSLIDLDDEL